MKEKSEDKLSSPSARALRPACLMALCLAMAMGAGVIFDRVALQTFLPPHAVPDFRLMVEAWNTIEHFYVDRAAVQPTTLAYGAVSGMVDALGDTGHSVFLTPQMVKQLSMVEGGQLKGVGVEIRMKNHRVIIVAPIDDSPAQRAGLRSGDIIMSVEGQDVSGLRLDQVVERISGPAGTSVKLAIMDPQTHVIHNIIIVRAAIKFKNVTWQQLPGTAVADLRIASFNDDVGKVLRAALREIQQRRMQGLILDLRNNPGGVLTEAVTVASQFLTHGNVLLVKDVTGKITPMPVEPDGLATKIPMAVLINGGSASAAEIVAGAVHDAHRGVLVGETTFGTGTVLNEFPLTDGSALLLAVQEWLTPSGHSFWHMGITPELEVALPADVTPLVPEMERRMTPDELQSFNDQQLLRALKWVEAKINDNS
jgi:carboxyl-terminal processing protease